MSKDVVTTELQDLISSHPGKSPAWLAQTAGVSEAEVTQALVEAGRVPVSADRFDDIWQQLTQWEKPLTILIVSGCVIEINSKITGGAYARGFFNLAKGAGLSGHIKVDNIKVIYIVEEPTRGGGVSRQVAFYDDEGHRIFGVFVNREENTGEHHPATLAAFQALQETYRKLALNQSIINFQNSCA